jgi:type II secretory ATPase GspE/PulE/Tfp pilus assembly ATPase PilB-like protein
MRRIAVAFAIAVGLVLCLADPLLAQEGWPPFYNNNPDKHFLPRGPGFYFGITKLVLCWLAFLVYVRCTDWVNRDLYDVGDKIGLQPALWNSLCMFPFPIVLFGVWAIPNGLVFWIAYLLIAAAAVVPMFIYVGQRNPKVNDSEKVFTSQHLKEWFKGGKKGPRRPAWDLGPPIDFVPMGAVGEAANQGNLIASRSKPAYVPTKELVADALFRRATKILLNYTAQQCDGKLEIDGILYDTPPRPRDVADGILEILKQLCNLNPLDRRNKQEGKFRADFNNQKWFIHVKSQGIPTGERVELVIENRVDPLKSADDLGMRDKTRDKVKELLNSGKGFFFFSSMPGDGLSHMAQNAVRLADRLLRDYVCLEDQTKPEPIVENMEVVKYNSAAGETPDKLLPKILLKMPDALFVRDLTNPETLKILLEQVNEQNRQALTMLRARDAAETIAQVQAKYKPNPEDFANAVSGVLHVRLCRRLCDACKEAYQLPPEQLKRLGIPEGRVAAFYRERQPLPPESTEKRKPCEHCNELGYKGRIGIFELLVVDDGVRKVLAAQGGVDAIRKAAALGGQRSLMQEGILLVAQGITSLSELQRVLTQKT